MVIELLRLYPTIILICGYVGKAHSLLILAVEELLGHWLKQAETIVSHRYKRTKHCALFQPCVGLFLNDEGG